MVFRTWLFYDSREPNRNQKQKMENNELWLVDSRLLSLLAWSLIVDQNASVNMLADACHGLLLVHFPHGDDLRVDFRDQLVRNPWFWSAKQAARGESSVTSLCLRFRTLVPGCWVWTHHSRWCSSAVVTSCIFEWDGGNDKHFGLNDVWLWQQTASSFWIRVPNRYPGVEGWGFTDEKVQPQPLTSSTGTVLVGCFCLQKNTGGKPLPGGITTWTIEGDGIKEPFIIRKCTCYHEGHWFFTACWDFQGSRKLTGL